MFRWLSLSLLMLVLAACAGRQRAERAAELDTVEFTAFRATTAPPPDPEPFGPGEPFEISCDVPIPDANDDLAIDRNCPDYGLGEVGGEPAPDGKKSPVAPPEVEQVPPQYAGGVPRYVLRWQRTDAPLAALGVVFHFSAIAANARNCSGERCVGVPPPK